MVASVVVLASQRCRTGWCRRFAAIAHRRVNLLESALPENAPVTRLESALPKSLDLKPFRIRTCEKWRGWGGKVLTRNRGGSCVRNIVSSRLRLNRIG